MLYVFKVYPNLSDNSFKDYIIYSQQLIGALLLYKVIQHCARTTKQESSSTDFIWRRVFSAKSILFICKNAANFIDKLQEKGEG
jgi:hypothetical protein